MRVATPKLSFAHEGNGVASVDDVFVFPATVGQRGFWYLDRVQPGNPAYNIAVQFRLRGSLRVPELERALNEIVRRHESLRTVFDVEDDRLVQVVLPKVTILLRRYDLRGAAEKDRSDLARAIAVEEAGQQFDLKRGPLIRGRLVQIDEDAYILLLTVHHLVADGWSIGVITHELGAIYNAYCRELASPLSDLVVQYGDFAVWQEKALKCESLGEQLDYWSRQLANLPVLEVPTDRPRPTLQTFNGAIESILLPRDLTERLTILSNREEVTPCMVLLATFKILLQRYSGQSDVFVGSVLPGRSRVELEPLIGLFINPIVLRTDLAGDPTVHELLARVRETTLQAFAHQDVPFERVVEAVQPKRDPGRSPLFQINFLYQRDFVQPFESAGVTLTAIPSVSPGSMYDLNFFLVERAEGLRASCEYNTDLFDASTINRLLGHFRTLLEAIVADSGQRIEELPLLTEEERQQFAEWNRTHADCPYACLHELFEAQASQTPDAIAAECKGRRLTYDQLNRRANRLARRLQAVGVSADVPVAILVDRSLDMVVAVLGILKAGGACLPLDPIHPVQRLQYMVENAKTSILLTDANRRNRLPTDNLTVVCLEDPAGQAHDADDSNVGPIAKPEHLAYILYTSGSTGRPKGVAMNHRPIVNLVTWEGRRDGAAGPAKTAQYASLGFDVAFQEMFATWAGGGTLFVVSEESRHDLPGLLRIIDREQIERLFLPVVVLQQLAETAHRLAIWPRALREIITAGEALRITPAIRRLFRELPNCRLTNEYGPTEAHVVTFFPLSGSPDGWPDLPPIGRPIDNAAIHLLDHNHKCVPVGAVGELYIGGECLSRGYVNQPDLTAERFVRRQVDGAAGARLYKTGDLARYHTDGTIEFLGRADDQVKIRGFRIELSEIESVFLQDPTVAQCAVVIHETNGEPKLVAYVAGPGGNTVDVPGLRARLKAALPAYMVPSTIVALDIMPLTRNGKVDRRALPAPTAAETIDGRTAVSPRNECEAELACLWQETLGASSASVTADFFDQGGNSLLAMSLLERIQRRFNRRLLLATFLQCPTIEAVAAILRDDRWEDPQQQVFPMNDEGDRPALLLVDAGPFLRPFVRALGSDQPVFGVALPELTELPAQFTVHDIAANLVNALLESTDEGPFYVAGWSAAGVIAYEMALQLRARGKDVALLVLFDTTNPTYYRSFRTWKNFHKRVYFKVEWVLYHFRKMWGKSPRNGWRYFRERMPKYNVNSLKLFQRRIAGPKGPADLLPTEVWKVLYRAAWEYRPQPCEIPITLVRSTVFQTGLFRDPNLGWEDMALRGLRVFEMPGEHDEMFLEPNVKRLAAIVSECMASKSLTVAPSPLTPS